MKKILITIVATVLVCACIVGGTFAWLMDKTDAVKNTFTVGMIDIELAESVDTDKNNTQEFKMIPGETITKDPVVTVKAGSEACWLFVKIEETDTKNLLDWQIASGWTALAGEAGVYYRQLNETATDTPYPVLKDNQVSVSEDLVNGETALPTLTFTAYAIQYSGFNDSAKTEAENVALAWAQAKNAAAYTQP